MHRRHVLWLVFSHALVAAVVWTASVGMATDSGGRTPQAPSAHRLMIARPDPADPDGQKNHILRVVSTDTYKVGWQQEKRKPNQWVFTFLNDDDTSQFVVIVAE